MFSSMAKEWQGTVARVQKFLPKVTDSGTTATTGPVTSTSPSPIPINQTLSYTNPCPTLLPFIGSM